MSDTNPTLTVKNLRSGKIVKTMETSVPTADEVTAAALIVTQSSAVKSALRAILKNGGSIAICGRQTATETRNRTAAKDHVLLHHDGHGCWTVTRLGRSAWNAYATARNAR